MIGEMAETQDNLQMPAVLVTVEKDFGQLAATAKAVMVEMVALLLVPLVLVVKVVQAVVPTPMMMVVMVKQEAAEAVVAEVPPMETQATLGMEEMVGTQILETQEILLIPILSQILL